jgi:enoyl-[acyl-carrier protein] reductase/trans-2-enoyl-CoA reductase (NAD+)
VAVLKAVVTQASSAIPVMPLYLALLFKVMKQAGTHEGCIEQIDLLFRESLYGSAPRLDAEGRWRADYKELEPAIQQQVAALWDRITTESVNELSDFAGYKQGFLQLFGFEVPGVDYEAEVDPVVPIRNTV